MYLLFGSSPDSSRKSRSSYLAGWPSTNGTPGSFNAVWRRSSNAVDPRTHASDYELHAAEIRSPTRSPSPRRGSVPPPTASESSDDLQQHCQLPPSGNDWRARPLCSEQLSRMAAEPGGVRLRASPQEVRPMLTRPFHQAGRRDQGLAIHDNRVIERTVQEWDHQVAAGCRQGGSPEQPRGCSPIRRPPRESNAAGRRLRTWALWRY